MNPSFYTYDFASTDRVNLDYSYWLDGTAISRAVFEALPSRSADLVEVALAAYTADRLSPRSFKSTSTGQRKFHIRVGVREPDLWNDDLVTNSLHEFLNWVSGDDWSFEFVRHNTGFSAAESESYLFRLPPKKPVTVSLFSGGLDSLAGLAEHALQGNTASCVLVSGYTNERLRHLQRLQVQQITTALEHRLVPRRPEIRHVAVPFKIRKPSKTREESSQRKAFKNPRGIKPANESGGFPCVGHHDCHPGECRHSVGIREWDRSA